MSNHRIFSNESNISFTDINGEQNGGRYFLVVLNDAGFEVISRNLYILPVFLKQPEDIVLQGNESVTLTVEVDGAPFPDIQWQMLTNGNFTDLIGENQSVLSLDYTDTGVYRCVISSEIKGRTYKEISDQSAVTGNFHTLP